MTDSRWNIELCHAEAVQSSEGTTAGLRRVESVEDQPELIEIQSSPVSVREQRGQVEQREAAGT